MYHDCVWRVRVVPLGRSEVGLGLLLVALTLLRLVVAEKVLELPKGKVAEENLRIKYITLSLDTMAGRLN